MQIGDFMSSPVITVSQEATIAEAVRILRTKKIFGIPVVDKEMKLLGIFTKSHLLNLVTENPDLSKEIGEVMTRLVVTATADCSLDEAYKIVGEKNIGRLPVVDDEGRIIGMVTRTDLLGALEKDMRRSLSFYKEELDRERGSKHTFDNILGDSECIKWVKREAQVAARTHSTILITGESGTGKEILAHAVHHASPRRDKPFISVNCAAVPENLLESELFGYDEGAFTGARRGGKKGKFELAQNGTIFLDEVGDMSRAMQAKLLRVLQEKEIERVGGIRTISVDVRVIAATNKDLEKMVVQGEFRDDLYYRLNVIDIHLPPLRDRKEDVGLLVQYFIGQLSRELGRKINGITQEALQILQDYHWPGNIRELENSLERAIALSSSEVLDKNDFLGLQSQGPQQYRHGKAEQIKPLETAVSEIEKESIARALDETNNNKKKTAEILGIHRSLLYKKMEKYGLS